MNFIGKTLRTGVVATLLLAGTTMDARGDANDSGSSSGPAGRDRIRIRGPVVGAGCTLGEVRKLSSSEFTLDQLSHAQGRLVLRVDRARQFTSWRRVAWPPQLWTPREECLLQRLTAEARLLTKIATDRFPSNTRTVHTAGIILSG